ncbi:hypothetical protein RSgd_p1045 (plasmid) [Ralstonia solanacearum]|uniref:DNA-binding protein H-NS-like C-terminal domain-containing protein n=1 Tax=Ralstonia solanacearum TaxID=305 RepID=A0A0S4VAN2_RALSL|nr:conserved protein of unknown function [Ralstonia solanacearum]
MFLSRTALRQTRQAYDTHDMKEGQQPDPGREAAIDWIQEQMETYGLTVEDLQALGCFDAPPKPAAPVYMNAAGQVWDGTGVMPDWLQRAVNAGQSIEHFRVN